MAAAFLARAAVRHPAALLAGLAAVVALSLAVILRGPGFDSDILNLLPDGDPAVEGLRQYERSFTQARELAFVLEWDHAPDDPEAARSDFAKALAGQPWVVRVLDGPPLGQREVIGPLFLNLPPEKMDAFLRSLEDGSLDERLKRLAKGAAAGSPVAAFELKNDPLGFAGTALRPVIDAVALDHAFDLAAPDGRLAVVPCVTGQSDLSPDGCRAIMDKVRTFLESYRKQKAGTSPKISVTGRAAYVVEVSSGMERDIRLTSAVSLAAVIGLFWLGFRSLLPLLGIALLLAVAAVVSTALGLAVFGPLNVVAIGFCSILFGLGDDFSLLICQRYASARNGGADRESAIATALRKAGPGIGWVSLTTALGFLALLFAGSVGFRQLGVLVALGVVVAAGLMLSVLPVFLRHGKIPPTRGFSAFPLMCTSRPGAVLAVGLALCVIGLGVAAAPWRPLRFDLSPSSLEPRNTEASQALAKIMTGLPGSFEPVIVLMEDPTPDRLTQMDALLKSFRKEDRVLATSSPTPLFLNGVHMIRNAGALDDARLAPIEAAAAKAWDNAGLSPGGFAEAMQDFRRAASTPPLPYWESHLSQESTWWFLIDRMTSPDARVAAAQIQVDPAATPDERRTLARRLEVLDGVRVTGWSQSLASLVPWAQRELLFFGGVVLLLISVILAGVYRDWRLWMLHLGGLLAAGALAVTALKLANAPINLLNVLALPLVLGVGVDYGTHVILAAREESDPAGPLRDVLKPVLISGLTTIAGFGALILAINPALSGLGLTCSVGVASCIATAFLVVAPGSILLAARSSSPPLR